MSRNWSQNLDINQKMLNFLFIFICIKYIKKITVNFYMILKGQRSIKKRVPLGQLNENGYLNKLSKDLQKDVKNQNLKEINLSTKQLNRLKQLKTKYKNVDDDNKMNKSDWAKKKQNIVDISFKRIQIVDFKSNDYNKSVKVFDYKDQNREIQEQNSKELKKQYKRSFYYQNFNKKIQQTNNRVESNIQRVQDKLNLLKNIYNKKQQINTNSYKQKLNHNYHTSQLHNSIKKQTYQGQIKYSDSIKQFNNNIRVNQSQGKEQNYRNIQSQTKISVKSQQKLQNKKNSYANQLKSINFVDEIKKKLIQLQHQRKTNLQKKHSQISQLTLKQNINNNQNHQQSYTTQQQQKITLAKLTPNLAQSQIIQITQRQRDYTKRTSSIESFVIKNYKFTNQNQTSRSKYNIDNKIVQQPQIENLSLKASPSNAKSPYCQLSNLDQTQFVQRNSLQGDLQIVQQEIQRQFTLLINRLAYQAQIDNKFACQIFKYQNIITQKQSLKTVILTKLKLYCQQNNILFAQNFLEVSQMELDPLMAVQKVYKDYSNDQIMRLGFGLKKMHDKNYNYFQKKLYHNFGFKTLEFLVQQLQKCHSLKTNEEINIGHLTSYINMRTGKNLRNRYFYRLLKRILKDNKKIGSSFKKQDLFGAFVKE